MSGGHERPRSWLIGTEAPAERIPDGRLRVYRRRGHFGTVAYRPAMREILNVLTADQALA